MTFKYRSTVSALLLTLCALSTETWSQSRFEGITDGKSTNIYWANYAAGVKEDRTSEILEALSLSLEHHDLFEYAFILEELLQSFENTGFEKQWAAYMDSLETFAKSSIVGAGLVPLQAEFFHASLEAASKLRGQYPRAHEFLRENTPRMNEYAYKREDYEEILKKEGFSDAIGEGIILDFLMIESNSIIQIIEKNAALRDRYILWVETLTDPAHEFSFNEYRPREMFTRKKYYLISRLQENESELAKLTWPQLKKVRTSRIRQPKPDSFEVVLTGTWEGRYGTTDKDISIYLVPKNNRDIEEGIKGYNKFTYQSDIKQIDMEGSFRDNGKSFLIYMEEYKVPFDKEPQWKQESIMNDWGGPEKFYPPDLSYGVFYLEVDKETKVMTGSWSSKSGQIKREFTLPKVSN